MNTFFQSPTAEIFYDQELDTLFLKYLDKVKNDEEFISINSELLKAFESLSTNKFVADIRKMGIISLESQNWVANHLIPKMFEHLKGKMLYHAQLLDAADIFVKVSGSNIKKKTSNQDSGFEVKQFSEESELKEYLLSL